jgi:hypothetical protein
MKLFPIKKGRRWTGLSSKRMGHTSYVAAYRELKNKTRQLLFTRRLGIN